MISAFPTLGSVYYWIAQLVPKKHAPWLSWFVGWIYLVGSFCGTALNEFLLAQFIGTIVLLATGGAENNGYTLTPGQVPTSQTVPPSKIQGGFEVLVPHNNKLTA